MLIVDETADEKSSGSAVGAARQYSGTLGGIAMCQVAAMAVWFSASAVTPALAAEFHLSNFAQAALTSGVQAGFVIGCLVSAFLGLPDRVDPRRLFAASAAVAAIFFAFSGWSGGFVTRSANASGRWTRWRASAAKSSR